VLGAAPGSGAPASVPWSALALLTDRPPAPVQPTTPASSTLIEVGYWLMPKPADLGILLFDALQPPDAQGRATNFVSQMVAYDKLKQHDAFHPALSITSSLIFMILILALAGYEFIHTDY
jgi:hypothetical protein